MRVDLHTINDYNYKSTFKSMGFTFATYRDCYGFTRETQNTTGVREDINLRDFARILKWRFRNFDKVNIMPMNVADGTEAYMFANAIIKNEGIENFKKHYSINASDVIPSVINNYAKNGLLHLYDNEVEIFEGIGMEALKEVLPKDYEDKIVLQASYPDKLYKLSDEYGKLFNFHVEDLQSRVHNLKDEGNSVIAIRNCLKQSFGGNSAALILLRLSMAMKGGSLLITGDYDRKCKLIDRTLKENFTELAHNIWGLKEYGYVKNNIIKIIKLFTSIHL